MTEIVRETINVLCCVAAVVPIYLLAQMVERHAERGEKYSPITMFLQFTLAIILMAESQAVVDNLQIGNIANVFHFTSQLLWLNLVAITADFAIVQLVKKHRKQQKQATARNGVRA